MSCDVGIAERTERLLIALVAAGLAGLGVPYVLPAGLWILAVLTTITLGQRVCGPRGHRRGGGDNGRCACARRRGRPGRPGHEARRGPAGQAKG